MNDHFSHVHWGFTNGGLLPSGSEPVGRTTCPVEAVLTPADIEALRRAMNGEA